GIMFGLLDRFGVPGAALAIVKDGRLVLAKGYGLANVQEDRSVQPDSLFCLASVSKAITAATILKLIDEKRLGIDEPAFARLSYLMPPRGPADPRVSKITVRMLLNPSGGWDRRASGDPSGFSRRIQRAFRIRRPVTADELIRYMLRRTLDFAPGTEEV